MALSTLRDKSFKEDMTMMPLPLPKAVFGVEKSVIIDGLEIIEQKNQEHNQDHNPAPANQRFLCARDYTEAYFTKRITPLQVCICQYRKDDIIAQAEASTSRYDQNQTLGPLDGVPVAIKDVIDVIGYETRVGTSFLNRGNLASKDAFLVKKLREQGAIIIGKTNLQEYCF
ncbi:10794_t:CDS:2, partial [Racocetra fulgida]